MRPFERARDGIQDWIDAAKPQLFVLQDDLIAAVSTEEMYETEKGLKEMGLWKQPFDALCIDMSATAYLRRLHSSEEMFRLARESGIERIRAIFQWKDNRSDQFMYVFTHLKNGEHFDLKIQFEDDEDEQALASWMLSVLIVSLSVRNVVKNTTATGQNVSRRNATRCFLNYTTLLLPPASERENDPDHPATGGQVQPHMRRGHIRNQRHGPHSALTKRIWISPVFVNADPDYVQQRKQYAV